MTVDPNAVSLAVHFLKRVIPMGHAEQDQLYWTINRLQRAGQSQQSFATDSSHSDSGPTNT